MKLRLTKLNVVKTALNEGIKHFDCKNCIYSRTIYSRRENENKQICILFKCNFLQEYPYYETTFCRNNDHFCGKHGQYFELKEN